MPQPRAVQHIHPFDFYDLVNAAIQDSENYQCKETGEFVQVTVQGDVTYTNWNPVLELNGARYVRDTAVHCKSTTFIDELPEEKK